MLLNNCPESRSTCGMINNYTTYTIAIPVWKHIASSQNRYKEPEQNMKNTETYDTLKQTIPIKCSYLKEWGCGA